MGGVKRAHHGSYRPSSPARVIDGNAYVLWTWWSFRAKVGKEVSRPQQPVLQSSYCSEL